MEEEEGEGGDPSEGAGVGRMFVGEDGFACNFFPGKALGEVVEQMEEGTLDCFGVRFPLLLQGLAFVPLTLRHPSLAAQHAQAERIDELRLGPRDDVDVVGVVLGETEGFKPVRGHVLPQGKDGQKGGMNRQDAAAQSFEAVLDASRVHPQFPAQVQNPG